MLKCLANYKAKLNGAEESPATDFIICKIYFIKAAGKQRIIQQMAVEWLVSVLERKINQDL